MRLRLYIAAMGSSGMKDSARVNFSVLKVKVLPMYMLVPRRRVNAPGLSAIAVRSFAKTVYAPPLLRAMVPFSGISIPPANAGAVVNRVRKASVEAVTLGEKRPMDDSVQATDSCDPSSSVLTHPNALCKSAPLLASWEGSCVRGIFI